MMKRCRKNHNDTTKIDTLPLHINPTVIKQRDIRTEQAKRADLFSWHEEPHDDGERGGRARGREGEGREGREGERARPWATKQAKRSKSLFFQVPPQTLVGRGVSSNAVFFSLTHTPHPSRPHLAWGRHNVPVVYCNLRLTSISRGRERNAT